MNTIKRFVMMLAAAAAFFITGCAGISATTTAPDPDTFEARNSVAVIVEYQTGYMAGSWFQVVVRFTNQSTYPGLVQEIWNEDGTTLVEYFECRSLASVYDKHSGTGVRMMRVYPGRQRGMDLQNGWGHVPQNRDGSVLSTVGKNFNADYQESHETRGEIVDDMRDSAATWFIRDGVVHIAGGELVLRKA